METFGKFCFGMLMVIISALLGGFVFMKLWEWFVVYTFKVDPLSMAQSVGLLIVWSFLTHKHKKTNPESIDFSYFAEKFVIILVSAGMFLGIGYLITLFQ